MEALSVIGELILGFIVGTLVLWLCSFTVSTQNANLKTAAKYNAIMTVLGGVLLGIAQIVIHTESGVAGMALIISAILTLIVSFWLLMRFYDIRFLATIWLVIAMYFVDKGVEKLIEFVF